MSLKAFCREEKITLGTVQGIGATNDAEVGLFETKSKNYLSHHFTGDFEITSLLGNITTFKGEIYLHLHATLCGKDHHAYGGHLNSATVSATFEAVIEKTEGVIEREFNDEIGLNLLKI